MSDNNYRNQGAVGALLDEYERAIADLKAVLEAVNNDLLAHVFDAAATDEDCRSIQTVMAHVIRSGYGYAIEIRRLQGEKLDIPARIFLSETQDYIKALDELFAYNVKIFEDYPNIELETADNHRKITTSWGQTYDVEQIFEHGIVHILRHRRQIERWLQTFDI